MNTISKELTVEALLYAARKAAFESAITHPEDIAAAMVGALDGAASAIIYMHHSPPPEVND